MSYAEWSNKKKKEKQQYNSYAEWSNAKHGISEAEQNSALAWRSDEIAPVKGGDKSTWFKSGGFSDGVTGVGDFFGDLGMTTGGTLGDVGINFAKGAARTLEGVLDLGAYGIAGIAEAFGGDKFAEGLRKSAMESQTDAMFKKDEEFFDQYSVLGDKADASEDKSALLSLPAV